MEREKRHKACSAGLPSAKIAKWEVISKVAKEHTSLLYRNGDIVRAVLFEG